MLLLAGVFGRISPADCHCLRSEPLRPDVLVPQRAFLFLGMGLLRLDGMQPCWTLPAN